MADLIERQAAIDAVKGYWKAEVDAIPKDADFCTVTATCDLILKCNTEMCKVLDGIPSAQPERKIGKWIHDGYDKLHGIDWCHCSVCGNREDAKGVYVCVEISPYCSRCGSKMEGDKP